MYNLALQYKLIIINPKYNYILKNTYYEIYNK